MYSFFAEAQRIVAEEYVPSTEDILHATERGVMETYFEIGQLSIRISQVYGQECEQRRWIHLFEGVASIIFYASLFDYDEVEDERAVGWGVRVCLLPLITMYVTKRY
jgi:guanine nucleotide-binding protein G(i) subunit alpha